jgi:hypothetical protein
VWIKTIVRGSTNGLELIPASGGEPTRLTTLGKGEVGHYGPNFLPNGRAVIFYIFTGSRDTSQVAVYDFNTGKQRTLIAGTSPRFAASGHLVFWRGDSLLAVPFDPNRLEVKGNPVLVVERVGASGVGYASYALAAGMLVYVPPEGENDLRTLVWVNRNGQEEPLPIDARPYSSMDISPNGRQLAIDVSDPENWDIWIYDLARHIPTRFTFDPAVDRWPLWTPDGERIAFGSSPAS